MKTRASPQGKRSRHTYSEEQLAGLRASTSVRKQETLERLRAAIESLQDKKQAITAQSIYAESGLQYATLLRNPEAINHYSDLRYWEPGIKAKTKIMQSATDLHHLITCS